MLALTEQALEGVRKSYKSHGTCCRSEGLSQCQGRGCAKLHLCADEGENKVLLLETDYRHYIIFYMQNIKNGTKTHALALYGNPTLSAWESQPLGGHLPWALDTLWHGA